jgi:sulfide:quinone oxidoreductase
MIASVLDVVIAGGGIAGLEALLALREWAGDRVRVTLVAPSPQFTYKPLAVAIPFARGRPPQLALVAVTREAGAEFLLDTLVEVDDAAGELRLRERGVRAYDALLVALGAEAVDGVEGAVTWRPGGDAELYGGLLADIDEGFSKQISVVIPPGFAWPLPAYELALMTKGEADAMGRYDVTVTVVTPEREPLALLGERASEALVSELARAGVVLVTDTVITHRSELASQRVVAIPRLVGLPPAGVPFDDDGFILTDVSCKVRGATRTWAAGDGIASPVKYGGLATHQARLAAAAIARAAGAPGVPELGEPVLHGRLLLGQRSRRLRPADDRPGAPLWWPDGKVAGEFLPRLVAQRLGFSAQPEEPPPVGDQVPVRRGLAELDSDASMYAFRLGRRYRIADSAVASLGRRMRETRSR